MKIVPWHVTDRPWFELTIRDFLEANAARGGDFLLTDRNASLLADLGLQCAARGDPCLVAVIDDMPVGWLLWVGMAPAFDSRYKTINAVGSFTEPWARSKGVAEALRLAGIQQAKALGYERIIGPVHITNPKGMQVFATVFHAWPTAVQFEVLI